MAVLTDVGFRQSSRQPVANTSESIKRQQSAASPGVAVSECRHGGFICYSSDHRVISQAVAQAISQVTDEPIAIASGLGSSSSSHVILKQIAPWQATLKPGPSASPPQLAATSCRFARLLRPVPLRRRPSPVWNQRASGDAEPEVSGRLAGRTSESPSLCAAT